jgi:hypothetical protein
MLGICRASQIAQTKQIIILLNLIPFNPQKEFWNIFPTNPQKHLGCLFTLTAVTVPLLDEPLMIIACQELDVIGTV